MLVIKQQQLAAFEGTASVLFLSRLKDYLREHHGDGEIQMPAGTRRVHPS